MKSASQVQSKLYFMPLNALEIWAHVLAWKKNMTSLGF